MRRVIGAGPSSGRCEAACSGSALGMFFSRQAHTASELANALSPSNEDLRVVTHTRSLLQTAPRTGHFAKKVGAGRGPSASVMLRRAHRCRAERLAGGGPRRPPGRCAPFLAFAWNCGPRGGADSPTRLRRRNDRGNGFLRRRRVPLLRPPGGWRRDPRYWTGARRNARADARKPGRSTPPSAKRRANAAKARGLLRKAAGAPTYNA